MRPVIITAQGGDHAEDGHSSRIPALAMTDGAPSPSDPRRPRSQSGGDGPSPDNGGGRSSTRAFKRRPMPGAIDPGPASAPPDAASPKTPLPPAPPMPVAGQSPGKRTTAPMPAVRSAGTAPTLIMQQPTPTSTPAGRVTAQMPAIRPPGREPTQLLKALPPSPAALHVPGADDAESLVKTRTANLRSEAVATRTSRLRPPTALGEGTAHIPSGAGGYTTDVATSTRVIGHGAPPPSAQGRPRYWISAFVYVALIVVVGGVSLWATLFFWNMSHPRSGHDADYARAGCPWLPAQATHISFRETPMSRAAVFTIDEDPFLAWVKANGFQDVGVQQPAGDFALSTQHAITVAISPDEVVRGDASNGFWFEKRLTNGSGYTAAYDRGNGIAYFVEAKSIF